MIDNPQNVFEQVQNDLATEIMTDPLWQGLKLPDQSDFAVLTEDEGDPEMLFTAMLARAGLCIIVQAPSGKIVGEDQSGGVQFNPFVVAVSISEAILFNRSDNGTKVRLLVATKAVLRRLHRFAVPSLKERIYATRLLKDKDTQPGTDELIATRIITFEATEVYVDLA
jgi:hypothetical protein